MRAPVFRFRSHFFSLLFACGRNERRLGSCCGFVARRAKEDWWPFAGRTTTRGGLCGRPHLPPPFRGDSRVGAVRPASFPRSRWPYFAQVLTWLGTTVQRGAEPAWHRRQRRRRGDARALLRVASASKLLAAHHSAQPQPTAAPHMARGRWSRHEDGWTSWEANRGRSQSRGRSARRGNDGTRSSDASTNYRKECERLQKELDSERKKNDRGAAQARGPRPNAREGPPRDDDWLCGICGFKTNRTSRLACYRCAAVKGHSFPAGSVHVPPGATAAAHPGLAFTSSSTASCITSSPAPSSSAVPPGQAQTWTTSFSASPSAPVLVPGFAGTPLASASFAPTAAATPVAPQSAAGIKPLKGKLDALLEARVGLAANSHCSEALASIDIQIAKARAELASAQPLEIALKGTLGAVAAARHALQRAEAKASKLEQQVVSAVAAFDAATAEVQQCRKQLTEAEATTAKTASGHVDLYQLFEVDPGAAWAAFRAAYEARCGAGAVGVTPVLRSRAAAAFAEMQSVCALLPAQPPKPASTSSPTPSGNVPTDAINTQAADGTVNGGAAPPAVPAAAAAAAALDKSETPSSFPAVQGNAVPTATVDAGAVAAAAITASLERQSRGIATQLGAGTAPGGAAVAAEGLLQPSSADVPSHFEAVAAAAKAAEAAQSFRPSSESEPAELVPPLAHDERQAFQAQLGAAEREARSQAAVAAYTAHYKAQLAHAAAAAALVQQPQSEAAAHGGAALVPIPAVDDGQPEQVGTHVAGHVGDGGGGPTVPAPPAIDDSMGGAAVHQVVGKRGSEAIAAAKAIAARAKAKV